MSLAGGKSKMCISAIQEPAARYIVPDCLSHMQTMFERNTSNIKEAGCGRLL